MWNQIACGNVPNIRNKRLAEISSVYKNPLPPFLPYFPKSNVYSKYKGSVGIEGTNKRLQNPIQIKEERRRKRVDEFIMIRICCDRNSMSSDRNFVSMEQGSDRIRSWWI